MARVTAIRGVWFGAVFLLWLFFLWGGALFAQGNATAFSLRGVAYAEGEPLVGCVVMLPELEKTTVTDADGSFLFDALPRGRWSVDARMVGFTCLTKYVTVDGEVNSVQILLQPTTYSIADVTVVARRTATMGNVSSIDRTALEHQQTSSIADALQLMPGAVTQNPDLANRRLLTLRETKVTETTNALGVAVVVDGAQLSNDANMQRLSTATSNGASQQESGGGGLDSRTISTDRIESVEVIRGVAPVEYGNLTSGALIVRTKAGVSPWRVSFKADPRLKSFSLSKGFALGGQGAAVAADVDYAYYTADVRSTTDQFRRLTAQLSFTDTYRFQDYADLHLNVKFNGHYSANTNESDPDMVAGSYDKQEDKALSLNVQSQWMPRNNSLPAIDIALFGKVGWQINEQMTQHIGDIPMPFTNAMMEGEHLGAFYPIDYAQVSTVDGRPVEGQVRLVLRQNNSWGAVMNRVTIGAELNRKGNKGAGKGGEYLPNGVRPRSFSEIPPIGSSAFFIEEKLSYMGRHRAELQVGLRMTHIDADGYNFNWQVEPRLGARYTFPVSGEEGRSLAISASWGIMKKMPLLIYLYPDRAYSDQLSYSYADASSGERKSLFTSCIVNTENRSQRIMQTRNSELGLELRLDERRFYVSYYNEHLTNGLTLKSKVMPYPYRVYDSRVGPAHYDSDNIFVDASGTPVPFKMDTTFCNYTLPSNSMTVDKWGVEYTLDFGKIKPLHTQIYVDGAYMNIKRSDTDADEYYSPTTINGMNRKYAAVMVDYSSLFNVSHSEQLTTSLRLIVHIPKLAMVCTLKYQEMWFSREWRESLYKGKVMTRLEDDRLCVYPIALIRPDGSRQEELPADIKSNSQTSAYVHKRSSTSLLKDDPNPYGQLDFKLSKNVGKAVEISLYVNNLTNFTPKRYYASSDQWFTVGTATYFGFDVKVMPQSFMCK